MNALAEKFRFTLAGSNFRQQMALLLISVVSFLPAALDFLHGHDAWSHLGWNLGFADLVKSGVWYPRWLPDANQGEGSPLFVFYGPLFSWLVALCAFFMTVLNAMITAQFLVWWGSALAMLWLARRYLPPGASLMAATIYLLFPYHLYDLYVRAAFAELLQFIWLPLIVGFTHEVVSYPKRRSSVLLSATICASILSHVVTAAIFLYLLAAYCGWLILRNRPAAIRTAWSVIVGVLLAGVYLLPALWQRAYIHAPFLGDHWNYKLNFLFRSNPSPGAASSQLETSIHVILLLLLMACIAAALWNATRLAGFRGPAGLGLLLMAFAVFMTLPPSEVIWRLPGLAYVMFPMRWLIVAAFVAAALIPKVWLENRPTPVWRVALGAALAANLLFSAWLWGWRAGQAVMHDHEWQSNAAQIEKARFRSEITAPPAWLPNARQRLLSPEMHSTPVPLAVVQPAGQARIEKWDYLNRQVQVETPHAAVIELRAFYYPSWRCHVNGSPVGAGISENGRVMLRVSPGRNSLRCAYSMTSDEKLGAAISAVAAFAVLTKMLIARRRRNWQH